MSLNLRKYIDENLRADVATKADKCPIRHILPYLKIHGGTVEQVLVAENGLEISELAAFCIEPKVDTRHAAEIINGLREAGHVKMIHPFPIKPDMKRFGYSWSEISMQSAIECIFTPELYFIRFLGYEWY